MRSADARTAERYTEYNELEERRQNAFVAQELLDAGFEKVSAEDFGLTAGQSPAAAVQAADARQKALAGLLAPFEAAAGGSLACALARRRRNSGSGSGSDGTDADEIRGVVAAANAIATAMPELRELRLLEMASTVIEHNTPAAHIAEQVAAHHRHLERRVAAGRDKIRVALSALPCPAGFAAGPMTVAERCGLPSGGPFAPVQEVFDRAMRLHAELLGRMATIAGEPGRS